MTVARLLTECDSMELTLWQQYFKAAGAHDERRREQARLEREIGV